MVSYVVITLLYAVPEASAKYGDLRNGLLARDLREIIRRSHLPMRKLTLLITLLAAKGDDTLAPSPELV